MPHPEQGRQRDLDKWKVMRTRGLSTLHGDEGRQTDVSLLHAPPGSTRAGKGGAGPLPPRHTPEAEESPEPRRERSQDSRDDSDRRTLRGGYSQAAKPAYPPRDKRPLGASDDEVDERRRAKRARREVCVIKGCDRNARDDKNTCCEVCSRTGG